MLSVTAPLADHARDQGDRLAVADGDTVLSWQELARLVQASAERFRQQGMQVGDRVALRAADGAPSLVAALAVLEVGGIHVPVDHQLAVREVVDLVGEMRPQWVLDLTASPDALLHATGHPVVEDPCGPGASAFIRHSSGTTGRAKGVLLTHDTIMERTRAANAGLGLGPADRVLWCLPMAYHFAVSILLYLRVGAGIVFGQALRAERTAAIACQHRCTMAYLSPWHVARLARLPSRARLPDSLRQAISTTTALPPAIAQDFRTRHGIRIRQALGIIEVGLPFISPGDGGEPAGFVGRPLPEYRIRIVASDGSPCPTGAAGELLIAGPGLFDAYLNPWRPRAEVLDGGFFRTGDRAEQDAQGQVRLLGRLKEVINVGGMKVFPLEVEAVVAGHPDVIACRVRNELDPRTGECVGIEIEARAGCDREVLAQSLMAWCAERLAPLKRPAKYHFIQGLPTTPSGKIRR